MKRCPTCQEDFADKFGFCPVDGTPLSNGYNPTAAESVSAGRVEQADNAAYQTTNETTAAGEQTWPAGAARADNTADGASVNHKGQAVKLLSLARKPRGGGVHLSLSSQCVFRPAR